MDKQARQMLALLAGLETMCAHLPVWAFTSHAHLCLSNADVDPGHWLVKIIPVFDSYRVAYRVPETNIPDAVVADGLQQAQASTPEEALAQVAVAMELSRGWATPGSAA